MTAPHRATAEQWADVEDRAADCQGGPACLLELRARVEALEARDREDADAWTGVRRTMSELRAKVEALEAAQQPDAEAAQSADPQTLHGIALEMVDSLGRSFDIQPEILETLRRAIRAPMQGEGTVKTSLTAQPQPVSSLVDAVAFALAHANGDPMELWRSDAVTAAFAVADWLEQQSPDAISTGRGWAKLLRQEVQP